MWALMELFFMVFSVLLHCVKTSISFRTPIVVNETELAMANASVYGNPKALQDSTTAPYTWLVALDVFIGMLFVAVALARITVAPDRRRFFFSLFFLNELAVQLSFAALLALEPASRSTLTFLFPVKIFSALQSLRIIRIFRIAKLSDVLRVLVLVCFISYMRRPSTVLI